jgi:hypothetical protein
MGTTVTVSFSLITVALLLTGCSTGWPSSKPSLGGLAPDDAIAIIAHDDARAQEGKLVACARRELKGSRWAKRIVAPDEFRRLALTNPSQRPRSHDDWAELARDPSFQERIAGLNLRYLIVVKSRYWKSPSTWNAAPNPASLVIWADWDVYSEMSAQIVDLPNARHAGMWSATGSGTSSGGVILVYLVVPIPWVKPSFPEGVACSKFGEGVSKAFWGNEFPETRDYISATGNRWKSTPWRTTGARGVGRRLRGGQRRPSPGVSADRGRRDGGAGEALELERLHHEGELVHALAGELVELQVLQEVDAVHHEHDLVHRQRDLRIGIR